MVSQVYILFKSRLDLERCGTPLTYWLDYDKHETNCVKCRLKSLIFLVELDSCLARPLKVRNQDDTSQIATLIL